MKRKIIICDLDGTLYNSVKRSHLAQAGKWDEFHESSLQDEPNLDVLESLLMIDESQMASIIAITGRNEKFRLITLEWFAVHEVPIETLLMRPDANYEPDKVVKLNLLDEYLQKMDLERSDVIMALEDRDKMVDAWREIGIPCWQVRAGEY